MERTWWKHGVIYQIYPRSFCDSNGDGIGDIPGIISKLDYLQDLGIEGIWLSPIYRSPMYDFGYDIEDYRSIDPVFGTQDDFTRLLDEAHRRDIRIIMDLVVNHTSHRHAWFEESRSSRDNPKHDWYIWRDAPDGNKKKYPNNWRAAFGGRAWSWDETCGQYYLHSFLEQQPDLNWRNPQVKEAVFADISWWLDRGVDGFRLDVINFLLKEENLKSNPWILGHTPRPYDMQKHVYDRNHPDMYPLLREFRALFEKYNTRMMVGEVYSPFPDHRLSAAYQGNGEDMLHMAFDFSPIYQNKWSAGAWYSVYRRWKDALAPAAWPSMVLSNHDQSRVASRVGGGKNNRARVKLLGAMQLTLQATPFVYYGDELGMTDISIRKEEVQDPLGKWYWPLHKGRDPERSPMQWDDTVFGGFSTVEPWLPLHRNYVDVNVEQEKEAPDSVYRLYHAILTFRRSSAALQRGDMVPLLEGEGNVLAWYRIYQGERVAVLLNFSPSSKKVTLDRDNKWEVRVSTAKLAGQHFTGIDLVLAPHEVLILERVE